LVIPKWNVDLMNLFARFSHAMASVTKQCNLLASDRALPAKHRPTFSVLGCWTLAARLRTFGFPSTNIYATCFTEGCNVVAMPPQNSLYVVLTSCRHLCATTSLHFSDGKKSSIIFTLLHLLIA